MTAHRFTRTPYEVDAWPLSSADDATAQAIIDWVTATGGRARFVPAHEKPNPEGSLTDVLTVPPALVLDTPGGAVRVEQGDVVVREADGTFRMWTAEQFMAHHVAGSVRSLPSATAIRAALLGLLSADAAEDDRARVAELEAGIDAVMESLA